MKPEVVLLCAPDEEYEFPIASDRVVAIIYVDDAKAVHVTGPDDFVERWSEYFRNEPFWPAVHLQEDAPLSSLLGRSGYTLGKWFEYTPETRNRYEVELAKLNNVVTAIIPEEEFSKEPLNG